MTKVTASFVRQSIPKAVREQTWIRHNGAKFNAKCNVSWCNNKVTPFTFEVGHNVPVSKGGPMSIENLRPICPGCNRSMGNKYTIDEFSKLCSRAPVKRARKCFKCRTKMEIDIIIE